MKDYDVLVVGGGAAGLSAALVLLRARRRVALVDAGVPRNAPAAHMHGFLSRDGMPPGELLAAGRAEVLSYGGRLIDDTVVGIEPGFQARLANGSRLRARQILVATGLRDQLPDIPGVRERWGRDLLHCPTAMATRSGTSRSACWGVRLRLSSTRCWFGSGRPTSSCSPTPTPSPRGSASTSPPGGIRVVEGTVARLVVDNDQLHGVELGGGPVIPRTAVFVRPRFVPNAGLLTGLGCAVDEHGWVVHDPVGRTSVAGVWVAGNAADPRAQVISAAGEGSAAAIALNADLVDEDVKHALADHRTGHTARPA